MSNYGGLIEQLIALKDRLRGQLTLGEQDAINGACNALERASSAGGSTGGGNG